MSVLGIERVVEEIKVAVEASERTHEVLMPNTTRIALSRMKQAMNGRDLDERILRSAKGSQLFVDSLKQIANFVWEQLTSINDEGQRRFHRSTKLDRFTIFGPCGVNFSLSSQNVFSNSVRDTILHAYILLRANDFEETEPQMIYHSEWKLTCLSETELGYKNAAYSNALTTNEVGAVLVEKICQNIIERSKTSDSE